MFLHALADIARYQPGRHPEHPAAVEGCRLVSRGFVTHNACAIYVVKLENS